MRLLIVIAAFLVPASSAAVQPLAATGKTPTQVQRVPVAPGSKLMLPGQKCPDNPALRHTVGPDRPVTRNLGELPPGNLQFAVVRNVGGCVEPVIVRYGLGGEPSRQGATPALRP